MKKSVSLNDHEREIFSKIQAIAFDWSGTLCDDLRFAHAGAVILARKLGIDIECDPIAWGHHPSTNPVEDLNTRLRIAQEKGEAVPETLLSMTGEKYSNLYGEILDKLRAGHIPDNELPNSAVNIAPKPITTSVSALKDLWECYCRPDDAPFYLVSACPINVLMEGVHEYGLDDIFLWDMHGSCNVKATKLTEIAAMRGIPTSALAYVGDTAGDVRATKRAGAISIGVTTGYHAKETVVEAGPDLVYDTAGDFCMRYRAFVKDRDNR